MKKRTRRTQKPAVAALLLIAVIAVIFGKTSIGSFLSGIQASITDQALQSSGAAGNVERVVDGDTLIVMYEGVRERVRMIGVDTPESVHSDQTKNTKEGKTASDYTGQLLSGKTVELEFDTEKRDRYGRLLAYVYVDGKMINRELLKSGMARIMTVPPNVKYAEDFKQLQKEAARSKKGFWDTDFFKQ